MKTSSFRQKVARRVKWWAASTAIVLGILLFLGYAFLTLVDDVENQIRYLTLIGGIFIVWSFILGQAVNSILVRSWDTWVGSLDSTQIAVLIPELEKQRARLENGK